MVDCGPGSSFTDCTCSGVAQRVIGPDGKYMCCGYSNLNGFRFESRCRAAGWSPTEQQTEQRDLWQQVAEEAVPIIFTRDAGLATIDCYSQLPYPLEYVIGEQRERVCAPSYQDPYRLVDYDDAVKVYEIAGCDYPASGKDDRTTSMVCGPKPDNSYFQGPLIPNPGSPGSPGSGGGQPGGGGGGGGGDDDDDDDSSTAPTPWYQAWWFWLLMAILAIVVIALIVFGIRQQQKRKAAGGFDPNAPLATEADFPGMAGTRPPSYIRPEDDAW